MSKNSLIPMVFLGLVLLCFPLFIHNQDSRGYNGPSLYAGIYRGQEGRVVQSIAPAALEVTNTVQMQAAILGKATIKNYQQGLEGPTWHNTIIVAEDDEAVTKSVVKAFAELLTGMLGDDPYGLAMPFYLVHVQPYNVPVRPWGVSRIIRIATIQADPHPQKVADAFAATVSICVEDPRLPDQSRAFIPLAAGGVKEFGFTVQHQSHGTNLESPHLQWANWYATIGRSIAGTAMRTCLGGDTEEMDWQMLGYDTEFGAWRKHETKEDGTQALGKKQLLPVHADHGVLTWFCGFQEPLARGWTGAMIGLREQTKMGSLQDNRKAWTAHVNGSGLWVKTPMLNDSMQLWKSSHNNSNTLDFIYTGKQPYGADILTWMVEPQIDTIYNTWLKQAAAGDANARVLLRRYLLCEQIDAAQRQQGLAFLRQQPSLADVAIIGLHPDATAQEQAIAQAVAFVRGVSDDATAAQGLSVTTSKQIAWDLQPLLVKTPSGVAIFLAQKKIKEGQPQRLQIWWRNFAGSGAAQCENITAQTPLKAAAMQFTLVPAAGNTYTINRD